MANDPGQVTAGNDILAVWGNDIRDNINELFGKIVLGTLIVGSGARTLSAINPPTGIGFRYPAVDLATKMWTLRESLFETLLNTIGGVLIATGDGTARELVPPSAGTYYIVWNNRTAVMETPAQVQADIIPRSATGAVPTGLPDGTMFLDTR